MLLIGIAASSSFQTNRDVRLQAGQTRQGRRLHDQLRQADRPIPTNERHRVRRPARRHADGKQVATLNPSAELLPDRGSDRGAIGRFFIGESTSEVGLKTAGRGRPLDRVPAGPLGRSIPRSCAATASSRTCRRTAQEIAILALAQHYVQDPPPANFRVIVNPLVGWIWIGALIALAGAVMAGWPALESRRRLEAAYRARLGQELGTATAAELGSAGHLGCSA